MALNIITISFEPCNPAPANGYIIKYRPTGTSIAYRTYPVNVTSSPAIIEDDNDSIGTSYEGIISGDCGNGIIGVGTPWTGQNPLDPGDSGSSSESISEPPPEDHNIIWDYDKFSVSGSMKIIVDGIPIVNVTSSSNGSFQAIIGAFIEVIVQAPLTGSANIIITGPYNNSTTEDHITSDEFTVEAGIYHVNGNSLP